MAEKTGIQWCDHTFNSWIGCTKVSPACDHCYAEALMDHRHHRVEWGGERSRTSIGNWRQPLRWNRAAREAGIRRKVFCASLADVFDNQVPEEWRRDLWALIALCPDLDWLLLTKRPQNIAKMLPDAYGGFEVTGGLPWPWPHVWLGTTAENQEEADRRINLLRKAPAAKRFVSFEPLLGPIECYEAWLCYGYEDPPIDWAIVGGESGAGARPMHPDWARSLRDQCAAAGVPYHFKQWGAFKPSSEDEYVTDDGSHRHILVALDGRYGDSVADWLTSPRGTAWMRAATKKAAGRLLDGIEHNGMPG